MKIKDPFARKMVLWALIFASVLVVMVTVFTTVYLHVRPRCSEDVVLESASPGGQWIATAMERRCGEEAPFSTHVNLRASNRLIRYGFFSGKANEGEVFASEHEARALHLELVWDSSTQMTIHCPNCTDVSQHQGQWGNVLVKYKFAQEHP